MPRTQTVERRARKPPFGAPHVFVLAGVSGANAAMAFRITARETWLGRGQEADVDIDDAEVSKRHCVIRVDGPVCTVSDTGSRNGTFVNGRRLRTAVAQRLRHLDEIQLGSTRLLLLSGRFRQRPRRA